MRYRIPQVLSSPDPRYLNPRIMDLFTLGDVMVVSLRGIDSMTFQIDLLDGTWPVGAVLSVELSNDGLTFYAVPTTPVTYAAAGLQAALSVTPVEWARLRVSSIPAASARVRVTVCGEGTDG